MNIKVLLYSIYIFLIARLRITVVCTNIKGKTFEPQTEVLFHKKKMMKRKVYHCSQSLRRMDLILNQLMIR